MAKDPLVEIRLLLSDLAELRGLEIDNGCMPLRRRSDGIIEMDAVARESTVAELQRMNKVTVLYARTIAPHDYPSVKALVSQKNRYAKGALPCGPGTRRA
jgi:hypothetical protein